MNKFFALLVLFFALCFSNCAPLDQQEEDAQRIEVLLEELELTKEQLGKSTQKLEAATTASAKASEIVKLEARVEQAEKYNRACAMQKNLLLAENEEERQKIEENLEEIGQLATELELVDQARIQADEEAERIAREKALAEQQAEQAEQAEEGLRQDLEQLQIELDQARAKVQDTKEKHQRRAFAARLDREQSEQEMTQRFELLKDELEATKEERHNLTQELRELELRKAEAQVKAERIQHQLALELAQTQEEARLAEGDYRKQVQLIKFDQGQAEEKMALSLEHIKAELEAALKESARKKQQFNETRAHDEKIREALKAELEHMRKQVEATEEKHKKKLEISLLKRGRAEDEMTKSFHLEMIADEESQEVVSGFDDSSLITYRSTDSQVNLGINEVLSPANYDSILKLNDLSYAVAKKATVTDPQKSLLVQQRRTQLKQMLSHDNWSKIKVIKGKTGYNNSSDDDTCIVSHNKQRKLIVVAFHGSRSGSMLKGGLLYNDGKGDWGANYDYSVVGGDFVQGEDKFSYIPSDIELHRGFANNFRSAQSALLAELDRVVQEYNSTAEIPWIIVTGHSKGGAMASIAAPVIKVYLNDRARIGAILISAPRAFHNDHSRAWVHKIVGKRNILRVNVYGDPATQVPRKGWGYHYRSVGMLALDAVESVDQRIVGLGMNVPEWTDVKGWPARYHYGFARDGGLGFHPPLVMQHKELLKGLELGRTHLNQTGKAILTESFMTAY